MPELLHFSIPLPDTNVPFGEPTSNSTSQPLNVLSHIENPACLHISAATQAAQERAPQQPEDWQRSYLRYELPRLRLNFCLKEGLLESQELPGYHLSAAQDACPVTLSLPSGLRSFLMLHPDSTSAPVVILIRQGEISVNSADQVCISLPEGPTTPVQYHRFEVHPRTQLVSAANQEGSLFLAALYAAGGTSCPLPRIGRTGGEVALELLRQSFVNRPLSPGEAANLAALASFSLHTPALRLLCASIQERSTELAFLWNKPAPSIMVWPDTEERMYVQENRRLPATFAHARRSLTPFESRLILNHDDIAISKFPAAESDRASTPALPVSASQVEDLCLAARAIGVSLFKKGADNGQQGLTAAEAFDCSKLNQSAMGTELVADLDESLAAAGEGDGAALDEDSYRAASGLIQRLLQDVVARRAELQSSLLTALSTATAGKQSQLLSLFQHSELLATPTVSDLIMLAADDVLAQARFFLCLPCILPVDPCWGLSWLPQLLGAAAALIDITSSLHHA